jgi:hypothetical protein
MTSKEKAEELVERFTKLEDGEMYIGKAKECALIIVDEILDNCYEVMKPFWLEVKQEIKNL